MQLLLYYNHGSFSYPMKSINTKSYGQRKCVLNIQGKFPRYNEKKIKSPFFSLSFLPLQTS